MQVRVFEIEVRTALSRSRIGNVDYSLNPYTGCSFGCAYCYARVMPPRIADPADWGSWIAVKTNLPKVLAREVVSRPRGHVLLSSVTDPYVYQEADYRVTRRALEILVRHRWPITILTKSPMVIRDLDILARAGRLAEVGFSIPHLDERAWQALEPNAPHPSARLGALRRVAEKGIRTFVFIAPVIPGVTHRYMRQLILEAKRVGARVMVDSLHPKRGLWPLLLPAARKLGLERAFRDALYGSHSYFAEVGEEAARLGRELGVRVDVLV